MGLDITCFIETRESHFKSNWTCKAEYHLSRDTELFGYMANGILIDDRSKFSNRGVPSDVSSVVEQAYILYVDDDYANCDHSVPTTKALDSVAEGKSFWWNNERTIITHPDYFSASWLTVKELEQILSVKQNYDLEVIINIMQSINRIRVFKASRLIFWFDR
ncbi:MAG: hypothetical protein AAF846_20005 [Chloroflexota bacterium]